MMNIVFTICSVNYLASAKALYQSVVASDAQCKFVFIIADKINGRVKPSYFENAEVIEAHELGISFLDELTKTYNISEFNTAIKPYAIKFMHSKFNCSKFIFLDPDILVFHSLNKIWDNLNTFDFIVTPHHLEPITDPKFYAQQIGTINTGIFNFGFLALNYNLNTEKIINWWAFHMREHGHSNSLIGEFYDQKIMNLLPIFSDKLLIEKDPGYNVAGWNIHERKITGSNGQYKVNGSALVFFHFSGFLFENPKSLVSKYNSLSLKEQPSITEIHQLYRSKLTANDHIEYQKLSCAYPLQPDRHRTGRLAMFKHKITRLFK